MALVSLDLMKIPARTIAAALLMLIAFIGAGKATGQTEASETTEDTRPAEHRELCGAAKHAIHTENTELMKALLQAGFLINEVLDPEFKQTALHFAVMSGGARITEMLLANGADPNLRDKLNRRAIDLAVETGNVGLCKILTAPERTEDVLAGFPKAVFDELFKSDESPEGMAFLDFNGAEPPKELLAYFRGFWRDVRPISAMEEVSGAEGKTSYRDAHTKDHGILVQVALTREGDNTIKWSKRMASGPAMAGGGVRGSISKKYGYWLRHDDSSWDE